MRTPDPDSGVPLYLQVLDGLLEEIAAGRLEVGATAPSLRTLSAELRVNYHTVAKAYRLLEERGLVARRRGGGFVVAPRAPETASDALIGAEVDALVRRARALGLAEDDLVQRVRAAFTIDDKETA